MNKFSLEGILAATRLTRGGRLAEATARIQEMLRGGRTPAPTADDAARLYDGVTIEGTAEEIRTERNSRPSQKRTEPAGGSGGAFIDGSFSNAAGARPYKLYVPRSYRGGPAPLIVMLHGCTQSADDFAAGTRMNEAAEGPGCLVVYPEQTGTANKSRCWNWFEAGDQRREAGEPSLIAGITRDIMNRFAVDPMRVHVAGLSAGGAAAAIMGATHPDLYASIGVHSGLACGAARDLPSALMAMREGARRRGAATTSPVPAIVFHGDADKVVHPRNGEDVIAQAGAGTSRRKHVHEGRVPGGHAYSRAVYVDAHGAETLEHWTIHGAGHAWSGGSLAGSFTDPRGPDATREMLRFFRDHPRAGRT